MKQSNFHLKNCSVFLEDCIQKYSYVCGKALSLCFDAFNNFNIQDNTQK